MAKNKKIKVGFVSLGCPKNQVDIERMLSLVDADESYEIVAEDYEADVIIINTCAFIQSAKEESIENILDIAWLKENRNLKSIIVTGCLSERYREEIFEQLPEVDAILGVGSYGEIIRAIKATLKGKRFSSFEDKNTSELGGDRILTTPFYSAYIHKDILELLLILRQHIGAVTQQYVGLQQQIVEVHSSVSLAAAAVLHIYLAKLRHLHLPVLGGKARVRHIGTRGNQGILGVGDTRENTRRLVLVVCQIALLADCLDEILAVVGLIDGECLGIAYALGILPQDTRKDRVESTHSDVVRRRAFDHLLNALTHLACRLVGEGEGEDVPGLDTLLQHICYA